MEQFNILITFILSFFDKLISYKLYIYFSKYEILVSFLFIKLFGKEIILF